MNTALGIVMMCRALAGAPEGVEVPGGEGAREGTGSQPAAVVYVIPQAREAGGETAAVSRAVASASRMREREAEPLVERKVEGPAGGVRLPLGGRFRGTVVARVGPGGRLQGECGGEEGLAEDGRRTGPEGSR